VQIIQRGPDDQWRTSYQCPRCSSTFHVDQDDLELHAGDEVDEAATACPMCGRVTVLEEVPESVITAIGRRSSMYRRSPDGTFMVVLGVVSMGVLGTLLLTVSGGGFAFAFGFSAAIWLGISGIIGRCYYVPKAGREVHRRRRVAALHVQIQGLLPPR
jgi:DNA-directed RNA polymerase subunit RPC12/RpoP